VSLPPLPHHYEASSPKDSRHHAVWVLCCRSHSRGIPRHPCHRTTRRTSESRSTSEQEDYSELSEDDVENDEAPKPKRSRASQSEPGNGAPKRKRVRSRPPLKEGQVRRGIPRRARVPVPLPGRVAQPLERSELATVTPDDVLICMGIKLLEPFTTEEIMEDFFKQRRPTRACPCSAFLLTKLVVPLKHEKFI
jgi:hypothetical protein